MVNTPRTIQIFLPDGNARGIRIADITNRIVQAIQVPRSKILDAGTREEIKNVGIYFLFGEDKDSRNMVYIGEAENCYKRLLSHNKNKDFWNMAVIITSKTNNFTKSHAKYLEWYSIDLSQKVNRYKIENSTYPAKPHISEQVEADLIDNLETIKVLLSTLGFPILDSLILSPNKKNLFYCKGKGAIGMGEYTEDGFVVYKDSTAVVAFTKSSSKYIKILRERLIDGGILILSDSHYMFAEDFLFKSPSAASDLILARSSNGWTNWKDGSGKTLDNVLRK